MIVGTLKLYIYIPESHSLKDKRQVLKSFKEKVRRRFNVSICELDMQNLWEKAVLGVAYVNSSHVQVEKVLDRIINFGDTSGNFEILKFEKEIL